MFHCLFHAENILYWKYFYPHVLEISRDLTLNDEYRNEMFPWKLFITCCKAFLTFNYVLLV